MLVMSKLNAAVIATLMTATLTMYRSCLKIAEHIDGTVHIEAYTIHAMSQLPQQLLTCDLLSSAHDTTCGACVWLFFLLFFTFHPRLICITLLIVFFAEIDANDVHFEVIVHQTLTDAEHM